MTVVVCVDDRGGILFNQRRVSSDRKVIADMIELFGQRRIRMRPYSAKLFQGCGPVSVSDDYLTDANREDVVFLEDAVPEGLLSRADRLVLYRWNRLYPSDVRFPAEQLSALGNLSSAVEFKGHSHDRITREVYLL